MELEPGISDTRAMYLISPLGMFCRKIKRFTFLKAKAALKAKSSFVICFWKMFLKSQTKTFKISLRLNINPAGNYMFKVNNRNTGSRCKICLKLTIKTPERHQWRRSGVFIVNFEHISLRGLVFQVWTLAGKCRQGNVNTYFQNRFSLDFLEIWTADFSGETVGFFWKLKKLFSRF